MTWPIMTLLLLLPATTLAQPVKTSLCDLVKQPETFNGKLVQFRATIESGEQDLPSGASDQHCATAVKFVAPDDASLAALLKNKDFRKLTHDLKKSPIVAATVTGWFEQKGGKNADDFGLILESVTDVVMTPVPKQKHPRTQ